uniref:receptor protein-tyrosine kinase n=1 Tax=Acrobeloides nanus TaxID=290746 RepID=A0A914E0L9_9BILA
MSPSYPNMANLGLFVDGDVFACTSGTAIWKVSINAEIPENCPFIFYADDQPPVKVWNASLFHLILNFTAVKLVTVFNGTACANDTYRGYVVQIDAEYTEPDNTKTVPIDYPLIIGLSAGGFIVVCMIIISIAIYCIRSKQKRYNKIYKLLEEMNLTQEEINEMKLKSDGLLIKPGKIHINFDTILGKGASSTVHKGHLIGSAPLHEQRKNEQTEQFVDCDVAVKVTNHFGTSEVEQLFKEIDAMKKIGYHENVMCLLGWALPGETPCLVFEIAHKDLLHYVSEFKELVDELVPYKNFLSILWQITKGMQFTASKGLVHCDLAARNVLLFDNMVAKISDFGLCCSSDETFSYQASLHKKLPIKWLSLEALLDRLFTEKSDVWSFGVLMHEMFSFGATPYETMNNDELVMFLQSGGRLERPANMDDVCYGIMLPCWNKDYLARPGFMELEEKFGELIKKIAPIF